MDEQPDFDPEPDPSEGERLAIATPDGTTAYCWQCDEPLLQGQGFENVIRYDQLVAVHPRCAKEKPRPDPEAEHEKWRRKQEHRMGHVR